jgi:hypothetical protein
VFDSDALLNALRVAVIIVGAYLLVMWIAAVLWTYRDIQARTVSRVVQAGAVLLVALFNVPGLLFYLAVRPREVLVESYNRQLEAEAFLQEIGREKTCPDCSRAIDDSFVACPYCRATLQTPCHDCGRNLKSYWILCPYCAAAREKPAAVRGGEERAQAAAAGVSTLRVREANDVGKRAPATRPVS